MAFEPPPEGLQALEARLRRDLDLLCYPPANWVPESCDGRAYDANVVVVGAGMCGLTAGFALLRLGIGKLQILDERPSGREGPWVTFARMRTLRSPKHLTGPALGIPSLTFRAWFEAQWGSRGWHELGRIPRTQWMDYLRWYRRALQLPVSNDVRVLAIEPLPDGARGFRLMTRTALGDSALVARKVILATGRERLAHRRIPPAFAPHMGKRCQHTSEAIDFDALRGKRVVVIGVAASALDNAARALEAGAAVVRVLARAERMPRVNKAKGIVYGGFTEGFPHLADHHKLALMEYIASCGLPAPRETVQRVARHEAFELHMATEVQAVTASADSLVLTAGNARFEADHVILGTGFRVDLHAAPELRGIAPHIARWRDRHTPDSALADSEFLDFPYLGPGFDFQERRRGGAPYLRDLHCFTHAASVSHGNVSGDIPAVSDGATRLARAVARDLFVADSAWHRRRLLGFEEPELLGDELALDAWWPPLPEA